MVESHEHAEISSHEAALERLFGGSAGHLGDDMDDDPICISISSTTEDELTPAKERDEVKEVKKMSSKDTRRVNNWRLAALLALFLCAAAVTFTTYYFLKNEERKSFENAFEQFSRTVGDAAVEQQRDLQNANIALATIVSGYAESNNLTWPFVSVENYEAYAANARTQGHFEITTTFNLVKEADREEYIKYANNNYEEWVREGHIIQRGSLERLDGNLEAYHGFIMAEGPDGLVEDSGKLVYLPAWQYSPPPASFGLVNFNILSIPNYEPVILAAMTLRNETCYSKVGPYHSVPIAMTQEEHDAMHDFNEVSDANHPHCTAFYPIRKRIEDPDSEIVAITSASLAWDVALRDLLPEGVLGIHAIIKNTCGQAYTYEIHAKDAFFMGEGDLHEAQFTDMEVVYNLTQHQNPNAAITPGHCLYSMHIYPSSTFKDSYDENTPEIFAAVVAVTFCLVAVVFYIYDVSVQKRNENLIYKAAQSNAIVSSLFPDVVRDRMIQQQEQDMMAKKQRGSLKTFLADGVHRIEDPNKSKPMAELFLNTTVLFADISGFTAWSSVREPEQVFTLLETLFQSFDLIAKKRRVFKVETVGDCYVAVCGLPEQRQDHAVCIARFARDMVLTMRVLSKELEITLGPDTGDLALRVGIHSGPVTAGVLRGERARFQLFGDTMNVASRMESTSKSGFIQASKESAELISQAGKGNWLKKREERVSAKGKGDLETYWILVGSDSSIKSGSAGSEILEEYHATLSTAFGGCGDLPGVDQRTGRLIDWNAEMLLKILKQIVARNYSSSRKSILNERRAIQKLAQLSPASKPLDEVREIITLPEFNAKASHKAVDPDKVQIPLEVAKSLRQLVAKIAGMYQSNSFHNFDHASHVVMSVIKLLSRIVAPAHLTLDVMDDTQDDQEKKRIAASLHDHTYGITSDPLTQFACAFAALCHDADHSGAPNAQLVKENHPLCQAYERSTAEQHSFDIAWEELMKPDYTDLRRLLFAKEEDLIRFRQLVVNSIMATDIADKDLKNLRNARWDKAFTSKDSSMTDTSSTTGEADTSSSSPSSSVSPTPVVLSRKNSTSTKNDNVRDEVNRKATIVIEHLIQASDVSHTMQHWHVYQKWNKSLYEELYVSYLKGRADKDPSEFWYQGEIGFFDYYIIPLTQKLKDCGVFGVSSDEYLNYALKNREEWIAKGKRIVETLKKEMKEKYGDKVASTHDQ